MRLDKRFMQAFHARATAAEMDDILRQLRLDQAIRRRAAELVASDIDPRNLALLDGLLKSAVLMTRKKEPLRLLPK